MIKRKLTLDEMYKKLFLMEFRSLYFVPWRRGDLTRDKATRLANIYAVTYTHKWWRSQWTKEPIKLLKKYPCQD